MSSKTNPAQQNEHVSGVARKSASSAKPARAAAGSVRVVPATSKGRRKDHERGESLQGLSREEKRARKQERRNREDRIYTVSNILMKQDEDYKKRRRVFWVLLGVGMALILGLWVMMFGPGGSGDDSMTGAQMALVVIVYVLIIGAFIYDLVRIRPIRNTYQAQAQGMSENKIRATIEKSAAEEDRIRAEKEAKKAARKKK